MIKSRVRSALLGSAVGVGLIAASSTAHAIEYNFGDVQVFLDTTVSAGVSMRTSSRNNKFLPEANGGPTESTIDVVTFANRATVASAGATTQIVTLDTETGPDKFAGSINADDGRLNFDKGDLTSGIVKMTNDIQANYQNYTVFARVNSFYDAVLARDSSYERFALNQGGKVDAARDIDLLDLYVSGDFEVGDLPLNLRAGKQVINWGEGTFILNGINAISPLDVNAFRRPGVEIKEGLLPVWALYGSIGLPYDLSLEAFYQLEFQEFQLDRPGTPFADSDAILQGGIANGGSFITSGINPGGFTGRNCTTPSAVSAAFDAAYSTGTTFRNLVCPGAGGTNPFVDYRSPVPVSIGGEAYRINNGGNGTPGTGFADIGHLGHDLAKDSGQYGLALRWYAEELNSTEFGFYFMNYHSRLPIASLNVTADTSNTAFKSYLLAGTNGSSGTRGRLLLGCFGGLDTSTQAARDKLAFLNNNIVPDTFGINAAAEALPFVGDGKNSAIGLAYTGATGIAVNDNSALEGIINSCNLASAQASPLVPGVAASAVLVDGAEIVVPGPVNRPAIGLLLEYPEDIKLYGMSFNTTVGDWGVQGEFSFRPNQPLQLDTDQLTLGALGATCILDSILSPDLFSTPTVAGATTVPALDSLQTFGQAASTCGNTPNGTTREFTGYVREEVLTAQIGTTATYTNSNPLIGGLGADLGILVTELGAMYVPDAPENRDFSRQQWANVCTSGTDLPLGAFLDLDGTNTTNGELINGCRPDQFSYGYVMLAQLQYNNAFGTPISLSPTLVWQHDVKGNAPAPLANYREGRKRINIGLNASYQSSWRGGISYTNFFGNERYSRDGDRDFVAINLSYSF